MTYAKKPGKREHIESISECVSRLWRNEETRRNKGAQSQKDTPTLSYLASRLAGLTQQATGDGSQGAFQRDLRHPAGDGRADHDAGDGGLQYAEACIGLCVY